MKTIAYYVSDAGFGHITRSLAVIEGLIKTSDVHIYLVCGDQQIEYAKVFLSNYQGCITYNKEYTEAGTVLQENSFAFDMDRTRQKIKAFLATLDKEVDEEIEQLQLMDVSLVVTDFSILGIKVAKKLGIRCCGITNYSFYDRYKKMGIENSLIQPFVDAYNQLDQMMVLKYADTMAEITCPKEEVGLISRRIHRGASGDFKTKYWPSCFLSIGQVANKESLHIDFQSGHIYLTGDVDIEGNAHVVKLPRRVGHSQDYIAASSLALIKPGWSVVAECLIAGVPIGVMETNIVEDGEIIEKLLQEELCFKMELETLDDLDIKKINMRAAALPKNKKDNDVNHIVNRLLEVSELKSHV